MSEEKGKQQQITQEQVKEFAGKLQAFYDGLPEDEKPVVEAVIKLAGGRETDVTGYSAQGFGDLTVHEVATDPGPALPEGPTLELWLSDRTKDPAGTNLATLNLSRSYGDGARDLVNLFIHP